MPFPKPRCPRRFGERACASERLAVMHRKVSYSAFNGYKPAASKFSTVTCLDCGNSWRTKAAFVDQLPDLEQLPGFEG